MKYDQNGLFVGSSIISNNHIVLTIWGDDPTTLEDLSKKYKISRERVRQIENKAFEKLQKHMLLLAKSKNLLPVN